ncbi:MAG: hypothetical protein R2795_18925 [Saprospiraceae bacterium]
MKNLLFLSLFTCLLLGKSGFAQVSNEAKTLLGDGASISTENWGFFITPSYGITSMDGSSASLFHLRGGLSIKDKISLGAYFSTSLNQINPKSETVQGVYMDYWTVGGFAEYTIFSKKVFHLTAPLYVGYGEVEMDNENGDARLGEANFFQIEPAALIEINLHKNVRFNIGAGYRFVGSISYRNFNQSDISGLAGYIGLKFGLFK